MKYTRKIILLIVIVTFLCGCDSRGENSTENLQITTEKDTSIENPDLKTDDGSILDSEYPLKVNIVGSNAGLYQIKCVQNLDYNILIQNVEVYGDKVYATYIVSDETETDNLDYALLVIEPFMDKIVANISIGNTEGMLPVIMFDDKGKLIIYNSGTGYMSFYDDEYALADTRVFPQTKNISPCFKSDLSGMYYLNYELGEIRYIDIETEIEETAYILPKEGETYAYCMDGMLSEDIVFCSYSSYDSEGSVTYAIDIAKGEIVCEMEDVIISDCQHVDNQYMFRYYVDGWEEIISGEVGCQPWVLVSPDFSVDSDKRILPEAKSVVEITSETDGEELYLKLKNYDLTTGKLTNASTFTFADSEYQQLTPINLAKSPQENFVIYNVSSEEGTDTLYLWDLRDKATLVSEDIDCFLSTIELDNSQDVGQVQELAEKIGNKYGIDICIGEEVLDVEVWDYELTPIYNTIRINQMLQLFDEELALYPENMLSQLSCEGTEFKIYLSGDIVGTNEYGLSLAGGLCCYNNGGIVVVLDIQDVQGIRKNLHHEILHGIENKLSDDQYYFDNWDSLNPVDFEYDDDYAANVDNFNMDYIYGVDEEAYFIDTYSKSFSLEDRARIMENAMCEDIDDHDGAGAFEKEGIRRKHEYLCQVIRQGFDTQGWPETTHWERVLR